MISLSHRPNSPHKRFQTMDPVTEHELLTPYDIYLFKEGKHFKLYEKLGSHPIQVDGQEGTHFAVWAPNAKHLSVIGDFNEWRPGSHPLRLRNDNSGVWEGFIAGPAKGSGSVCDIACERFPSPFTGKSHHAPHRSSGT